MAATITRRPKKRDTRPIYRLECYECMSGIDGVREIPKGWRAVGRIRSYRDSCRVTPRPGEQNFSLGCDWVTHKGYCPECAAEYPEEVECLEAAESALRAATPTPKGE